MKINISALERFSLRDLPANLAFLYQSAARGDVLKRVEVSLLLFEDSLINTATGEYRELLLEEGGSRAAVLAAAARDLIPAGKASPAILLLLPPSDFVATSYSMAVSGEKLVRSALQLQSHSLLPAYDSSLQLGVDASLSEGVALWYPAVRGDELFEQFSRQGLFLAAVMPRSLALLPEDSGARRVLVRDADNRNITLMLVEGGAIRKLLPVSRRDLEQEEFARQWEQATGNIRGDLSRECDSRDDWLQLRRKVACRPGYCFLPAGSLQAGREIEAGKRRKVAAGLAVAAVLVLLLPFISNWIQIQSLERRVENFREQSSTARALQDSVLAMEEEWGALYEYPEQDVIQVLRGLNEIIEGSLQQFTIDRGVIDIAGYAQDPAFLLIALAEREEFYDVSQSRTTSGGNSSSMGDRFGIRMNLSGVDFEGYESKYPVPGN